MKFLFTILIFLITACFNISAQEIKGWRVKAGTNIATQEWSRNQFVDISTMVGQHYEVGRELKVKPFLSFVSNLAYNEYGYFSSTKWEFLGHDDYEHITNPFRYLTLQTALKLQAPKGKFKPYLMAGYQGGILLYSKLDSWSSFTTTLQQRRHYDDGPVLALGFEMNTGKDFIPFIELSHYRSVRNILKDNLVSEIDAFGDPIIPIDVRNRVYTIGGGIKF